VLQVNIYKRNRSWCFHLVDITEDTDATFNADRWGQSIDWTAEQLANQKHVRRMSYDMWYFNRRKDAEQFKTFWTLKWS